MGGPEKSDLLFRSASLVRVAVPLNVQQLGLGGRATSQNGRREEKRKEKKRSEGGQYKDEKKSLLS